MGVKIKKIIALLIIILLFLVFPILSYSVSDNIYPSYSFPTLRYYEEFQKARQSKEELIDPIDYRMGAYKPKYSCESSSCTIHTEIITPEGEIIKNITYREKEKPKKLGYIIQFKEEPIVIKEKELNSKQKTGILSTLSAKEKLSNYIATIEKTHQKAKEDIATILGVETKKKQLPRIKEYRTVFNGIAINVSDEAIEKIKKLSYVKEVYDDIEARITLSSSVSLIGADKVWNLTDVYGRSITGQNITIAVIDTGVDYTHYDLGNCTSSEFLAGNCSKVIDGYDFVNSDSDPMDDHGHGTHVAGTAAGNGLLKGVAPDAKLVAYKVCYSSGACPVSDIISGIERATDPNQDGNTSDHYDIISISIGGAGNPDDAESQAVDNAVDAGVVVVVAAGNKGPNYETIESPGCARKAITVGASTKSDAIASFSSRGPTSIGTIKPDVLAPGVDICAAQWDDAWSANECIDTKHISLSGTSMATPHVVGLVALLKQKYNWTPAEVKMALRNTAVNLGYDYITQGWGRIDALAAVQLNLTQPIATLNTSKLTARGMINISGTAFSANIANWTLEYGFGYEPTDWTLINISNVSVTDGILIANWNTSLMKDGINTLRLRVTDAFNQISEDRIAKLVINEDICYSCTDCDFKVDYPGANITLNNSLYDDNTCIDIEADNITLDCNGHSITSNGVGNMDGGIISRTDNVVIKNCNVSGVHSWGIIILDGRYNTLINNDISNNYINLLVDSSLYGISSLDRDQLKQYFNHSIDTSNKIDGKPIFYYFDVQNQVIQNLNSGGIYAILSSNMTIQNNTLTGDGIWLRSTDNSQIINNYISKATWFGVYLTDSYNNSIKANTIFDSSGGIELFRSKNNNVFENHISRTGDYSPVGFGLEGIRLSSLTSNNLVLNNSILDGWIGLRHMESGNFAYGNTIKNQWYGLYLYKSGLDLMYNNIYNNTAYNLYNSQSDNITAELNWWGTNNNATIASKIYESPGKVDYDPWLWEQYPTNMTSDTDADGDNWALGQGDCNDNNSNINPGATEICNNLDDDCDGLVDEGCTLLHDAGFEEDNANGTFPSSGYWTPSWHPAESGAVVTTTAAHSGNNGLWAYTAQTTSNAWTGTYQEVAANPGDVFVASAFIRTPPPGTGIDWVSGSFASVRIEFLTSTNSVISYEDSTKLTTANTGWQNYSLTTSPAPSGTAKVRYRLYIYKPATASAGQSVANFDDAYLFKTETPQIYISKYAVGIRKNIIQENFTIKNIGNATLDYNLSENTAWLSLSNYSGSLDSEEEKEIIVSADRAFCSNENCSGIINVTSNSRNETINVYLEKNLTGIPRLPSIVRVDQNKLIVRKRLADGSLDYPVSYVIKGSAWTPGSIGTEGDYVSRRIEFKKWYVADIQLLKEMNVNTIYTFLDFYANQDAFDILDNLYKNGIMVIMTVDEDGTNNLANIDSIVPYYKNHPAILMWAVGNEWNINYYHNKYLTLDASAIATEQAAQRIKNLDNNHPVASIYGEIHMPDNNQPLNKTQDIVNNIAPSVDVWGLNIYRGDTFGTLFEQWKSITTKPMFLSEYGTDSYYTTSYYPVVGFENETTQANFNHKLWENIKDNLVIYNDSAVCLGGTVFESSDEWWKVKASDGGNVSVHDNGGFDTYWNPYAHPDGFGNEEYFGTMHIERKPKASYYWFKDDFLNVSNVYINVSEYGGVLQPYLIYPLTDDVVKQNKFFNFSSGVRCVGGDCGNVTATLDPYGPDGYNYTALSSTEINGDPFAWEEIITNNEGIPLWNTGQTADDSYKIVPINFTFPFYTQNYTTVYVSSNGRIHFTTNGASGTSIGLPSDDFKVIAPINEDMYVISQTQVFYKTYDNPKRFIVEYKDLDHYSPAGNHLTYEVILYEDGRIKFQYNASSDSYNQDDEIGINYGVTNNYYLLIEDDAPDLHKGEAVTFYPPHYKFGKGTISMNSGTPFYTINQNPTICYNMKENDVCNTTWQINATGKINSTYEFFTIYEPIQKLINSTQTNKVNITIIPQISNLFNINLSWGWNLISLPLKPADNTLKNVLSSIEGNYGNVFIYDGWQQLDNNSKVNETLGLWTQMLANDTLTLNGALFEYPINFNLKQGYNLIGYPSLNESNVTYVFENVNNSLINVLSYENNTWYSYSPTKNSLLNTLEKLKPGYGYFVNVNNNVTWVFDGRFR